MKDVVRFIVIEIDFKNGSSSVLNFLNTEDIKSLLNLEKCEVSALYKYGELFSNGKKYHMITVGQINNKAS